jgi:predicted transposase YdaD
MKTFPTPHDSFFRKFFSDASISVDFLQIHLPPALQAKCDFSTLAITSGSFVAMHRHLKQGHKRLPMIVPILFYHGRQSPYPYSMRWLNCFDDPTAAQAFYTQAFPLVDVTVIPDDEIKTHRKVALLEYVQKHIHEKDINIHLPIIAWLMEKFGLSKELAQCSMHYLLQKGNALDSEEFINIH